MEQDIDIKERMGRAVLGGTKCIIIDDADYWALEKEIDEREKYFGLMREGKPRYMVYQGVHVYQKSKTAILT